MLVLTENYNVVSTFTVTGPPPLRPVRTLFRFCVKHVPSRVFSGWGGGNALLAPLAMYPLGLSRQHPCPRTLPTSSRLALYPSGRKRLLMYPSFQLGANAKKSPGAKKWLKGGFCKVGNASLRLSYV